MFGCIITLIDMRRQKTQGDDFPKISLGKTGLFDDAVIKWRLCMLFLMQILISDLKGRVQPTMTSFLLFELLLDNFIQYKLYNLQIRDYWRGFWHNEFWVKTLVQCNRFPIKNQIHSCIKFVLGKENIVYTSLVNTTMCLNLFGEPNIVRKFWLKF